MFIVLPIRVRLQLRCRLCFGCSLLAFLFSLLRRLVGVICRCLESHNDDDGDGEVAVEGTMGSIRGDHRHLTVVVTVLLGRRVKDGDLVFGLVLGRAGRRDIRWDGIVPVARASEIHRGLVILERGVRDVQRRRNSRRLRRGQDLDQLGADRWSTGWGTIRMVMIALAGSKITR
jgi:hypothetical protein